MPHLLYYPDTGVIGTIWVELESALLLQWVEKAEEDFGFAGLGLWRSTSKRSFRPPSEQG
jgi:hypothetical protein